MSQSQSKQVWITGAHGLIGHYLVRTASQFAPGWTVRALTRRDFDLLDFIAIERAYLAEKPDLVIHCAAITIVTDAQKDPRLARRVNVDATAFLAGLAADRAFVFFSTDLVFDGTKGDYRETDAVNPLNIYGETKAAAEAVVLKNPRHLVVRTSLNAGSSPAGNRAFNEQLHRSLSQAGQGMKLFTDEIRCPIAAPETARAVWELAAQGRTGLYHVAGAEKLSRLRIGQLLRERWPDVTAELQAGLAREYPGPRRALNTSLDISRAQGVLAQPLPGFSAWLAAHPDEAV